jgi:ribosome-associated heat shock protein Hsp15
MQLKEVENLRIDKWLWAVRLFKTRSQAAEAIKKGRVLINGEKIKPSRIVKKGEVIDIIKPPVTYSYRVIGLLGSRQSAKIVVDYVKDITKPEELERLELLKAGNVTAYREKGMGRPTKKERREIDNFNDAW